MDIRHSLQERLSQQLTLSPQMLQSIRILNLNAQDLYAYVADEVEANPLIEFPGTWEPKSCGTGLIDNLTRAAGPSLRDDLRFQLHVCDVDREIMSIGDYVIDNIDPRGYLTETVEEMARQLGKPADAVRQAVEWIQTFEPAGVGASNIQECLAIQLKALYQDRPCVMAIARDHLEDLAKSKLDVIRKKTGCTVEQIQEAAQIIQSLTLFPGDSIGEEAIQVIIPEIQILVVEGELQVQILNELPELKIDDSYPEIIGEDEEAARFVQDAYSKARWLQQCIRQRERTLLLVATEIARQQKSHFILGTAPVPLTLDAIAVALHIHPSTVSRAVSERYYEFDRQVHSFKGLFPSRLKSGESDARIKEEIKHLIQSEDRKSPLSDQKIADLLNEKGMDIARRTIAKYRSEMDIEPACRRK